ncbi:MAG TPA: flagellar biosynthesis protein FlhF, partial [Rhodanobacter sp.]|nr:flagellar biosynthesis protein FlhF [Rhodanobacter sp.]
MKIKRFVAPDMRQAMREVREEQGPDAVILSTRRMDDGIEVIAAIDYDEALVREAARHGAPVATPEAKPTASPKAEAQPATRPEPVVKSGPVASAPAMQPPLAPAAAASPRRLQAVAPPAAAT